MPRLATELSAIEVQRLTTPGKYAVGSISGLMLVVKHSGARSWILRVTVGGRRRSIGLGPFPEVSLAEARNRARETKKKIKSGIDPIEGKRKRKRALIDENNHKMLFSEAARLTHEKKVPQFKNKKHAAQWITTIETYANPIIGQMPVDEIELPDILRVLEPLWQEKPEIGARLRQRLENVFAWAIVSGFRKRANPARWKNHLDAILPQPTKIKKVVHHPALPWQQIGGFMAELRKRDGNVCKGS